MNRIEQAVSTFKEGYNCSSTMLSTYGPSLGMPREQCMKAACAFGGGLARSGKTCGAVTGALMVIGLKYGQADLKDMDARMKTYKLAQDFMAEFAKRNNNTLDCRDLLGVDIGTEEGLKKAMEMNFHTMVCPKFIRDAAEILEHILASES